MADTPQPKAIADLAGPTTAQELSPENRVSQVTWLLQQLEQATPGSRPSAISPTADNQLVQVRLGVAASLFAALRCKHAPAAAHALRVAMSSSAWALKAGLEAAQRDAIEVAALLHDLGIIGVPDQILLKPGPLDQEEMAVMDCARDMSLEILRSSCVVPAVLEIVQNVAARYNGSKDGFFVSGDQIPLGARMVAITEAFDSMTTDHVYRPAMSSERAMAELFHHAGTQFDPRLVVQFAELHECDQRALHEEVAGRWMQSLDPEVANSYWHLQQVHRPVAQTSVDLLFQGGLLENMHDAVVFVDASLRVVLWNHGAERMTGISGQSVYHRRLLPEMLNLRDEKGEPVHEQDCPVACVVHSGVQALRRLMIMGRTGRPMAVDAHVIPVTGEDGTIHGAILLLHDASSEISLEQRCQNLHEKATLDPLTQVGNRAEFDRVHEMFVTAHLQRQLPCSLIMCDLDLFKQVNDTYGHQAGDEAIKSLASLLRNACRPGDLVARYGGEEFVMLCADCDNATAARRAEHVRKALSQFQQPKMEGRAVTASFGVTEIQPGDTPETMLRRADRALLMAKARGRNIVVQLGTGSENAEAGGRWGFWRRSANPDLVLEQHLVTPVPIKMAIEKLRGFVADHCAKINRIEGNEVRLQIDDTRSERSRRQGDRPVTFLVTLRFEEERPQPAPAGQTPAGGMTRTKIHVTVIPKRHRDRRRSDVVNRAREVLVSFRSYLMATGEEPTGQKGVLRRARRFLLPWLLGR
jgi:diguanylate cyclase (GGDEF)-like protein